MLLSAINCCVTLAVCGLAPSCCKIPFPSGKLSRMKGTTICVNTPFTYTLHVHVAVEETTRRVLLFRVIPQYMYRSTRDVLLSVLTFPFPSEFCPVDDSSSYAGPDVEWWTWTWTWLSWPRKVFYSPCLVDALFQARYCRYTAAKRCCNVDFGLPRHEHLKARPL